jgi:hypothetical protein
VIIAKDHDGGASITGGILGILVGAAFLIANIAIKFRADFS